MQINTLNETLDNWIVALNHYSLQTLVQKPDPNCWSIGQVYIHLLTETDFYIEQIEQCIASADNSNEQMTENARTIFSNNGFPDVKIRNDAPSNQDVPQPESKPLLLDQFLKIKARLNECWTKMLENKSVGKTKHPGLGYFSAIEWFQFTEMHMRHHLRQRKRIEEAINIH